MTVGPTAGPQTVLSKQTSPSFQMESQQLRRRSMIWDWDGECILLLGRTLARSTVQCHAQDPTTVTRTEVEQLHLWERRNRMPKHLRTGALITSSTTIVTMRDRRGRALLHTIGIRQCRMLSMQQVALATVGTVYGLTTLGRPILYSMCNWGQDHPWDWAQTIANSWRMSGDVYDSFDRPDARCPCDTYECSLPGFHCSVMNILNKAAPVLNKAQPGAWNDLDMLEVGNSGMTDDEYKTHFSMW